MVYIRLKTNGHRFHFLSTKFIFVFGYGITGRRRRGYRRAGRIGDEEGSRLVDCDELSLEWQSEDLNDIT